MTVFLITPEKREEIAEAVERARAKPIPWEVLRDHVIVDDKPTLNLADIKDDADWRPPAERVEFFGGVEAAISFEEQPAGIFRHLSVSISQAGRVINPILFQLIAAEFGIELDVLRDGENAFCGKVGRLWSEEFAPGEYAVNVLILEVEREAGHA